MEDIRERFKHVYDAESQKNQVARIVGSEDFETCLDKLEEFNRSVVDVHGLVRGVWKGYGVI